MPNTITDSELNTRTYSSGLSSLPDPGKINKSLKENY